MTSPVSPELQAKIARWREKAIDGTLSQEDMKEAILALRGDRMRALSASETSKRGRAKAQIKSADEMLDELGDL